MFTTKDYNKFLDFIDKNKKEEPPFLNLNDDKILLKQICLKMEEPVNIIINKLNNKF